MMKKEVVEEKLGLDILQLEAKDIFTNEKKIGVDTKYKGSFDNCLEVDYFDGLGFKNYKTIKDGRTDDIVSVTFKYEWNMQKELTKEENKEIKNINKEIKKLKKIKKKTEEENKKIKENNLKLNKIRNYDYSDEIKNINKERKETENCKRLRELRAINNSSKAKIKTIDLNKKELSDDEVAFKISELENIIDVNNIEIVKLKLKIKEDNKIFNEKVRKIKNKYNKSKDDLRTELYKNGFNLKFIKNNKEIVKHYVRKGRSSGSAKDGTCLFICEDYAERMLDFSRAGLDINSGVIDLAGIEAYLSLTSSAILEEKIKILPNNILLTNDVYGVPFPENVMATRLVDGKLVTKEEETFIEENLTDGMAILDKSVFKKSNNYKGKTTLLLRNKMYKGESVWGDIQAYFKAKGITSIEQLKAISGNYTRATSLDDIKLITTPSSVKYLKYGKFEDWLNNILYDWGVCKYEKPQKHFNGMVQTHYQALNTVRANEKQMIELSQDTVNYINLLKNDDEVFKLHIKIKSNNKKKSAIKTNEQFILKMIQNNEDFINTTICKNFRKEIINSYIKNVRNGRILVNGNYSVIINDPTILLSGACGLREHIIEPRKCINSKFDKDVEIVAIRSPQPTFSNICRLINESENKFDKFEKYFRISDEVIYINAIDSNIMQQGSSLDFDGDQFLVTDNKLIVELAKELEYFRVNNDFTPKESVKKQRTMENLAETDIKCSSNLIGEIINLCQALNSVYNDEMSNGKTHEELLELWEDICTLNTLSCIAIDACKKLSPVNIPKELDKIRSKGYLKRSYILKSCAKKLITKKLNTKFKDKLEKLKKTKKQRNFRPYFFKFIAELKDNDTKEYIKMETGMDYLEEIMDGIENKLAVKRVPLKDLLIKQKKVNGTHRKQVGTIINKLIEVDKLTKEIKADVDIVSKDKYRRIQGIEAKFIKDLKDNISIHVVYKALDNISKAIEHGNLIENCKTNISRNIKNGKDTAELKLKLEDLLVKDKYEEYRKVGRKFIRLIFTHNAYLILSCFKTKNSKYMLEEDANGDIDIYRVKFSKKEVSANE